MYQQSFIYLHHTLAQKSCLAKKVDYSEFWLKPKFTNTTPVALLSVGPLTMMAIEAPEPFEPLRTRGAWKRLSLFPFLI